MAPQARQRRRCGAVDVQYADDRAQAALVVADETTFASIVEERVLTLSGVEPYVPGQFYRRELPAIEAALATVDPVELLIVDGYVDLDPTGRPGLGAHVHSALSIAVIGVAKTAFHPGTHARAVHRGRSRKPLYVTAAGLALDDAAGLVAAMAGPYRRPDALRRVDQLARGLVTPTA